MSPNKLKIKIDGVPKEYEKLPFGRQIEHRAKIDAFKRSAKVTWLSIKRQSVTRAWREFIAMFEPTEWYANYQDGEFARDDSIEVYYKRTVS